MKNTVSQTIVMGLLLGGMAFSQVNAPASECSNSGPATNTEGFSDRNPRYHLQSGDTFDVNFEFAPEFNQTTTVQPDGFITMRDIGDLHVSGQTVPELT